MNTIKTLQQAFFACLQKVTGIANLPSIEFSLNTDEQKQQFGDITTNAAMILAKTLQKNPRQIAQEIITEFRCEGIAKIEIAGPGFLNIFLTQETIQTIAQELFIQKDYYFKNKYKDLKLNEEQQIFVNTLVVRHY